MYFFELSHAPPAFDIMSASIIPDAIAPASIPARHLGPIINPIIRGHYCIQSGKNHFLYRGLGGDCNTFVTIWFCCSLPKTLNFCKLPSHFYDNRASRLLDRQHGECSKEKGKHRSKYYSGHPC